MKTTTRWMAGLVALTMAGALHAAPASADSVRTLMDLTHARGMVEGMMKNLEATIRQGAASSIAQQSGGQPMTAAQQASLDRLIVRMTDLLTKNLRWEDLEPDYVRLYVDTFDQDEIDGMIAFYRTPTGQALIAKMPIVLQKSIALSQSRMQALMPQIMALVAEETKKPQ